jgi:hypothetical protein
MPVLFAGYEFKTLTKCADAQPEILRFLVGWTGIDGGPAFGTERKIAPVAAVSDLYIDRGRAALFYFPTSAGHMPYTPDDAGKTIAGSGDFTLWLRCATNERVTSANL